MPRSFTITLAAGQETTIPGRWKHLFVRSVMSGGVPAEIKGESEGDEFDVAAYTEIKSETPVNGIIFRNPLGAAAVVKASIGINTYQVAVTSPDTVTIDDTVPVDVNVTNTLLFTPAPNANTDFEPDTTVTTGTASGAISPPVDAKGCIVALITSGVTFGAVRLIDAAASYGTGLGIPLPVSGAPIYLDAAVAFQIANAHGSSVDVNVSWIIA